jgi:transcriptional regulator GlxA family with amidase domain
VSGLLSYLACILIRRLHREVAVPSAQTEPPAISGDPRLWEVIDAALGVCEANFRNGISRADVARAVGYSPGHLGHVFSSYLGHSLSDHLRNLRIGEGRHLLETTSLSIGEIAQAVGYTDPAHFARAFQRVTGTSPTEYRRHAGGP